MGIGDWFKRFRANAAAIEQQGETIMGDDRQSQAARAAREHQTATEEKRGEKRPDGHEA
jgi:hypothetical protein